MYCFFFFFFFFGGEGAGKKRAGEFKSLQAKDIGHGVEKGDWIGCFCHDVLF